jgi:taurine dioxygenase
MSVIQSDVMSGALRESGLTCRTLDAPFGVEVHGLTWGKPSAAVVAALTCLLRRHLLILFRGQKSPDVGERNEFFRAFGPLVLETADGKYHYESFDDNSAKEAFRTSDNTYLSAPAEGASELWWHNDQYHKPQLKKLSSLEALDVEANAVPTQFRDMYTAYETLAVETRAKVEWKQCTYYDPRRPGPEVLRRMCDSMHPVFTPHPDSGRRTLYVNDVSVRIVGLDEAASAETLQLLRDHVESTAPRYDHHWTDGDLVIWDNVGLQHRRDAIPPGQQRTLRLFEGVAEGAGQPVA